VKGISKTRDHFKEEAEKALRKALAGDNNYQLFKEATYDCLGSYNFTLASKDNLNTVIQGAFYYQHPDSEDIYLQWCR